jgi:enhancer of yellow 2 transcription factor
LEESGEKARLEEYLRQKLIECGWKDELKRYCLDIIRSKGLEKIDLDELVEELLPKGRALVPTKVKEDLLGRIKSYLESDPDYKRLTGF